MLGFEASRTDSLMPLYLCRPTLSRSSNETCAGLRELVTSTPSRETMPEALVATMIELGSPLPESGALRTVKFDPVNSMGVRIVSAVEGAVSQVSDDALT